MLVVEKGSPKYLLPPSEDALSSVKKTALNGKGYQSSREMVNEEITSNDEDEPDD